MEKGEMIDRLESAAHVLRCMPDKERGFLSAGKRGSWPTVIMNFFEAYGLHSVRLRLPQPAPAAIDRMMEVLGWLGWLGQKDKAAMKCVWLAYAEGKRTMEIVAVVGLHRNSVKQKRDEGMRLLLDHVNKRKAA